MENSEKYLFITLSIHTSYSLPEVLIIDFSLSVAIAIETT